MEILTVHYKGWLHWYIHKDDPVKYPIQVLENWAFVNPLVYFEFDEVFKAAHHLSELYRVAITSEQTVISTSCIIFINPSEILSNDEKTKEVINGIGRFLINLRYVSKQFEIPTGRNSLYSFSFQEIVKLPNPNFSIELYHSHRDGSITG